MSEPAPLTSKERTAHLLAHIDNVLANISKASTTRHTWTTREIENLLLDIRNEVTDLEAMAEHFDWIEARLKELEA